jgi:hypothetical protein
MGAGGLIDEFRGKSFPIGADPGATTVPNLFKQYTPQLVGASIGKHLVGMQVIHQCMQGRGRMRCTEKWGERWSKDTHSR